MTENKMGKDGFGGFRKSEHSDLLLHPLGPSAAWQGLQPYFDCQRTADVFWRLVEHHRKRLTFPYCSMGVYSNISESTSKKTAAVRSNVSTTPRHLSPPLYRPVFDVRGALDLGSRSPQEWAVAGWDRKGCWWESIRVTLKWLKKEGRANPMRLMQKTLKKNSRWSAFRSSSGTHCVDRDILFSKLSSCGCYEQGSERERIKGAWRCCQNIWAIGPQGVWG